MSISVSCGECGKGYKFPDDKAGTKTKCKSCGGKISIPELEADEAEAAPRSSTRKTAAKSKKGKKEKESSGANPMIFVAIALVLLLLVGGGVGAAMMLGSGGGAPQVAQNDAAGGAGTGQTTPPGTATPVDPMANPMANPMATPPNPMATPPDPMNPMGAPANPMGAPANPMNTVPPDPMAVAGVPAGPMGTPATPAAPPPPATFSVDNVQAKAGQNGMNIGLIPNDAFAAFIINFDNLRDSSVVPDDVQQQASEQFRQTIGISQEDLVRLTVLVDRSALPGGSAQNANPMGTGAAAPNGAPAAPVAAPAAAPAAPAPTTVDPAAATPNPMGTPAGPSGPAATREGTEHYAAILELKTMPPDLLGLIRQASPETKIRNAEHQGHKYVLIEEPPETPASGGGGGTNLSVDPMAGGGGSAAPRPKPMVVALWAPNNTTLVAGADQFVQKMMAADAGGSEFAQQLGKLDLKNDVIGSVTLAGLESRVQGAATALSLFLEKEYWHYLTIVTTMKSANIYMSAKQDAMLKLVFEPRDANTGKQLDKAGIKVATDIRKAITEAKKGMKGDDAPPAEFLAIVDRVQKGVAWRKAGKNFELAFTSAGGIAQISTEMQALLEKDKDLVSKLMSSGGGAGGGLGGGSSFDNRPPPKLAAAKFRLKSTAFSDEFVKEPEAAEKKYKDKVVEVEGMIARKGFGLITLVGAPQKTGYGRKDVSCSIAFGSEQQKAEKAVVGQLVKIKGVSQASEFYLAINDAQFVELKPVEGPKFVPTTFTLNKKDYTLNAPEGAYVQSGDYGAEVIGVGFALQLTANGDDLAARKAEYAKADGPKLRKLHIDEPTVLVAEVDTPFNKPEFQIYGSVEVDGASLSFTADPGSGFTLEQMTKMADAGRGMKSTAAAQDKD